MIGYGIKCRKNDIHIFKQGIGLVYSLLLFLCVIIPHPGVFDAVKAGIGFANAGAEEKQCLIGCHVLNTCLDTHQKRGTLLHEKN